MMNPKQSFFRTAIFVLASIAAATTAASGVKRVENPLILK